jgi:lysozyme family protein
MNPDFDQAVKNVLEREGILSDDQADAGGLTKYGISQKAYPNLDIAALTKEAAIEIYRRDYWDRCGAAKVQSQLIAEELFDTAVNMGTGTAVQILQDSLNYLYKLLYDAGNSDFSTMLKVDGRFGSKSMEALSKVIPRWKNTLWKVMNIRQFLRYESIVANRAQNAKFLLGWINRRTFELVED